MRKDILERKEEILKWIEQNICDNYVEIIGHIYNAGVN